MSGIIRLSWARNLQKQVIEDLDLLRKKATSIRGSQTTVFGGTGHSTPWQRFSKAMKVCMQLRTPLETLIHFTPPDWFGASSPSPQPMLSDHTTARAAGCVPKQFGRMSASTNLLPLCAERQVGDRVKDRATRKGSTQAMCLLSLHLPFYFLHLSRSVAAASLQKLPSVSPFLPRKQMHFSFRHPDESRAGDAFLKAHWASMACHAGSDCPQSAHTTIASITCPAPSLPTLLQTATL